MDSALCVPARDAHAAVLMKIRCLGTIAQLSEDWFSSIDEELSQKTGSEPFTIIYAAV